MACTLGINHILASYFPLFRVKISLEDFLLIDFWVLILSLKFKYCNLPSARVFTKKKKMKKNKQAKKKREGAFYACQAVKERKENVP